MGFKIDIFQWFHIMKIQTALFYFKKQIIHTLLFEKIVPFLIGFPATWLVVARFYAVKDVLTNKCHLLQIEKRGDLRPQLNQSLEVQLHLIDRLQ